jgi:hypothetical protein
MQAYGIKDGMLAWMHVNRAGRRLCELYVESTAKVVDYEMGVPFVLGRARSG